MFNVGKDSVYYKFFTFSTSSEPLHAKPPHLPQLFWRSVVSFWRNWKSKMAVLASDWTRYLQFLLQDYYMWSHQTCQKCSPEVLIFQNDSKSNLAAPFTDSDCFPQNYLIWSYQTCHKWSSRGSEVVLLLFGVITKMATLGWNRRWPPWPLTFDFFSKKIAFLPPGIPEFFLEDPKYFFYGENLVSAVLTHWINHKFIPGFIYIHTMYMMIQLNKER